MTKYWKKVLRINYTVGMNSGRNINGWSETEYLRHNQDEIEFNPEFLYMLDCLFAVHAEIDNNPEEPYIGVMRLFDADNAPGDPDDIRQDWDVISPYEIRRRK